MIKLLTICLIIACCDGLVRKKGDKAEKDNRMKKVINAIRELDDEVESLAAKEMKELSKLHNYTEKTYKALKKVVQAEEKLLTYIKENYKFHEKFVNTSNKVDTTLQSIKEIEKYKNEPLKERLTEIVRVMEDICNTKMKLKFACLIDRKVFFPTVVSNFDPEKVKPSEDRPNFFHRCKRMYRRAMGRLKVIVDDLKAQMNEAYEKAQSLQRFLGVE
uniref:Uncharacterized protein n=1 Tax=Clastoptera arizonana TaxID=38151 RepID=A0A1B6CD89_9HEMI